MGKKTSRIAQLERDAEALRKELLAVIDQNTRLREQVKTMAAQRKPSLADTAKREWQQLTDRILGAVGL